jgi:hypothetical protein
LIQALRDHFGEGSPPVCDHQPEHGPSVPVPWWKENRHADETEVPRVMEVAPVQTYDTV